LYISRESSEILASADKVGSSLMINSVSVTENNAKTLDHFGNITTLGGSKSVTEKLAELNIFSG